MLITKIITAGVDIQNPINVYSDADNNLMNILRDKYVGICYSGCYILDVLEIIERSDCYINQDGAPTFATLSVRFKVSAINYFTGEIINGCTILNKDDKTIICSTDNSSIMMSTNPVLESLTVGQKISVVVGTSKYNLNAKKITVNAVPLAPVKMAAIYKIDTIDDSLRPYFADLLDKIKEEESRAEQVQKKSWEFFASMMYAYKEPQPAPAGAIELNIKDLAEGKPLAKGIRYLVRDPRLNPSAPFVHGYSDPVKLPQGVKIRTGYPVKDVIASLLLDYYNYLRSVREMSEIYNTPELLEKHKNLWLIYRKAKI